MHSHPAHILDRIATIVLSCTVLLVLVAFIPGGLLPLALGKGFVLIVGTSIAFILWLVGRLVEGKFHIPATQIYTALGAVLLATCISALFSKLPNQSFFGTSFDQGALVPLVFLALVLFLSSVLFTSTRRLLGFFLAFSFVYCAVVLFQIVHLILPSATTLATFYGPATTPLGTWVDLAYISGAVLVGATLILELFAERRVQKFFAYLAGCCGLFFLMLANVFPALVITVIALIAVLVYVLLVRRVTETLRFPVATFLATLVLLFCVIGNSLVGGLLAKAVHAQFTAASPGISSTLYVARSSLHVQPLWGAGANRFAHEWFTYRPNKTNTSILWDTTFLSGESFLFTAGFLSGVLGLLSVLFFIFVIVRQGMRRLKVLELDPKRNFLAFSSALIAGYFLSTLLFAAAGISVTLLAFFSIGIFVALLSQEHHIHVRMFSFQKDYTKGLFVIGMSVLFIVLSVAVVVASTKRFASAVIYARGLQAAQNGNLQYADSHMQIAASVFDTPAIENARIQIAQADIRQILENAKNVTLSSGEKQQIQDDIHVGETAAQRSIALDSTVTDGYIALGDFHAALAPLLVNNSFTNARDAYQKAIALLPNNPKAYLRLATLYFNSGDLDNARAFTMQALDRKSNYAEAYGELGSIDYLQNNFTEAARALRTATVLDASNTNAWYYLALADQKIGEADEASTILNALHTRFPDNADITNALIPKPLIPLPAIPKGKK